MKTISDTQFFDSLLGDTMTETQYTILNPFSAQSIMDNVPSSKLDEMVQYFAWLLGVQPSTLVVKETA